MRKKVNMTCNKLHVIMPLALSSAALACLPLFAARGKALFLETCSALLLLCGKLGCHVNTAKHVP